MHPSVFIIFRANFCHGPTSLQVDFDNEIAYYKQTDGTIVSIVPQLSGRCIFIFKIVNHKGNLHVPPTLFYFFARNFCRGPDSLHVDFRQWKRIDKKTADTIVFIIPQLSGLCIFIFGIGKHQGNLHVLLAQSFC